MIYLQVRRQEEIKRRRSASMRDSKSSNQSAPQKWKTFTNKILKTYTLFYLWFSVEAPIKRIIVFEISTKRKFNSYK